MDWLLERGVLDAIASPLDLSTAQISRAMCNDDDDYMSGNAANVLVKSGSSATISVIGVMTAQRNYMAYYFGGGNTLYKDISAAILNVEADPAITQVYFQFASGGGEAQPVLTVGDMIAAMTKPTQAIVQMAASAAYWLASQCDEIIAANKASSVGSIGVVVSMDKPSMSDDIDITSTDAPNKRPDPETDAGKAVVREFLDQFADLFATAVAVGRDKTVETVNNTFGRGSMMLAEKALSVGMIDRIGLGQSTQTTTTGAKTMDLAELQASHPALFAQAVAVGHQQGVAAELDRVKYHALMGQKTGATSFALAACLEGTAKDDTVCMVEYMTFGRNNADLDARSADELALEGNAPAAADKGAIEAAAIVSIFDQAG